MTKSKFNSPQRQSIVGILVLFFDALQSIVRAIFPLLAIWIFKFDQINKLYLVLGTLLVLLTIAIIAYAKYLSFTFYIDDTKDEFIINSGVFNKSKTTIQLSKIQQVNINQSFIQRMINVYALDVDTAGSSSKEVKIRAISHELAISLKGKLLESNSELEVLLSKTSSEITSEKDIIQISFLSLVKVGLTSKYGRTFAILLAFFVSIYENIQNWTSNNFNVEDKIDSYINKSQSLVMLFVLICLLLIIVLVINLGRTIIKYFNFKIAKQQKSLILSYGLLNTRNTIIKPEKVQILTISQNYLQQKLNVLDIKIKQASVAESEKEERKSAIEIPGCNPDERDEIIRLLLFKLPVKEIILKPNKRLLIVSIIKFIILPIILLLLVTAFSSFVAFHYLYLIPFYIIFIGFLLHVGFNNNKLYISNEHIIKQSGIWDIDQEIIEIYKIQAISVSQLFWHKKSNVGSLILHTAGGSISFKIANFAHIKQLVNAWLYQVETNAKSWTS